MSSLSTSARLNEQIQNGDHLANETIKFIEKSITDTGAVAIETFRNQIHERINKLLNEYRKFN